LISEFLAGRFRGLKEESRRILIRLGETKWKSEVVEKLCTIMETIEEEKKESLALLLLELKVTKPEVIKALVTMMYSNELPRRIEAYYCLGGIDRKYLITELIKLCKSVELNYRGGAALALGHLGNADEETLRVLVALLEDKRGSVKKRAAAAIGWLGAIQDPALERLITNLETNNLRADARAVSAAALGELGSAAPEVVDALITGLSDHSSVVVAKSATALGWLAVANELVISGLLQALSHHDFNVRASAVSALGELQVCDSSIIDYIISKLNDNHIEVVIRAVSALGQSGCCDQRVIQALLDHMSSNHPEVVSAVSHSLSWLERCNNARAHQSLINLADSNDITVAANAITTLGHFGLNESTILNKLLEKISSDYPIIRSAAVTALQRVGAAETRVSTQLIKCLKSDTSKEVRRRAAMAVTVLDGRSKNVRKALFEALTDNSEIVKLEAACALSKLGIIAEEIRTTLLDLLQSDIEIIRVRAIKTLSNFTSDTEYIHDSLVMIFSSDPSNEVKAATAYSLGKLYIHSENAILALVKCINSDNREVRARVAVALADITHSNPEVIPYIIGMLGSDQNQSECAAIALYVLIRTAGREVSQKLPKDKLPILYRMLNNKTLIGHPIVGDKSKVMDIGWWLLQEYKNVYAPHYKRHFKI
jgi:HEAT repeat protein